MTSDRPATPDVEQALIDAMPDLVGCPVDTQFPEGLRSGRCVRVVSAGGAQRRSIVLDEATITWEASSSVSAMDCSELARLVRDVFDHMAGTRVGGLWVTDSSCTMPRWFPDENGVPRYTGTATLLIQN